MTSIMKTNPKKKSANFKEKKNPKPIRTEKTHLMGETYPL